MPLYFILTNFDLKLVNYQLSNKRKTKHLEYKIDQNLFVIIKFVI